MTAREARELLDARLHGLVSVLMDGDHSGADLNVRGDSDGWWIVGCQHGDCLLPRTRGCHTLAEALDAAEAWLAPELDAQWARKRIRRVAD